MTANESKEGVVKKLITIYCNNEKQSGRLMSALSKLGFTTTKQVYFSGGRYLLLTFGIDSNGCNYFHMAEHWHKWGDSFSIHGLQPPALNAERYVFTADTLPMEFLGGK